MVSQTMICLEDLQVELGEFRLENLSLNVKKGEYCVLLGPTGAGKTVLVEALCGVCPISGGSISIAGQLVTQAPPEQRGIGYVPQDYALYPFKTVEQNLAFGLEAKKVPRHQQKQKLDAMLQLLGIHQLRQRYPETLSGGEKQRVALGRALIIEPQVLLLDEPFSALDEQRAMQMIEDIRTVHHQLGITIIHICHRLEEALALADILYVMHNGRLLQGGAPKELFARPANLFVAQFLRVPNIIPGHIETVGQENWFFVDGIRLKETELPEGLAYACIPYNDLRWSPTPMPSDAQRVAYSLIVDTIVDHPMHPQIRLKGAISAQIPGVAALHGISVGDPVYVSFPRSNLHIFPENPLEHSKGEFIR